MTGEYLMLVFNRFTAIDPMKFDIGDLVEATVAFSCIPIKNNLHHILINLRALALLDSSQREVSF